MANIPMGIQSSTPQTNAVMPDQGQYPAPSGYNPPPIEGMAAETAMMPETPMPQAGGGADHPISQFNKLKADIKQQAFDSLFKMVTPDKKDISWFEKSYLPRLEKAIDNRFEEMLNQKNKELANAQQPAI